MFKMWLIHERKRRPKGLTKATTEIQEKENLIRQDFSADKPYTNASMVNFAFHQSSTALMGISYRLLSVITWRKNYVSILLKLHRLDTQSVGWPFIQIEEANIQATVSEQY